MTPSGSSSLIRGRDGERTERRVEPYRLVLLGRRWYLVAWDLTRQDWRSFRLDRLAEPGARARAIAPRELPGGDAAEFVRAGIASLPASYSVEAVVARARRAPSASGSAAGRASRTSREGRCRLRMTTDSLDWPAMALGSVGVDFEVVSPPELVESVRDWAQRFTRAAGSSGNASSCA